MRALMYGAVPDTTVVSTVNCCEPTISVRAIDADVAVEVIAALAISVRRTAHPRTNQAPSPLVPSVELGH
jgi:hypothetical protein